MEERSKQPKRLIRSSEAGFGAGSERRKTKITVDSDFSSRPLNKDTTGLELPAPREIKASEWGGDLKKK